MLRSTWDVRPCNVITAVWRRVAMASGAARRGMSTPGETDPVSPGEFDGSSQPKAGLGRLGTIAIDA
jgi:hypothetical protein